MTKPGAKAPTSKASKKAKTKAATKPGKQVKQVEPKDVAPLDWPPGVVETKTDTLFELIEGGDTIRRAATKVQLAGNTVYQWKRRYSRFAERLMEAEEIGYEMMIDFLVEDAKSAKCRDTAAGTKERREAAMEFLRSKNPQRFKTSPFKAPGTEGETAMIVGVVLVPQRSDTAGQVAGPRPVIEGTATQVLPHTPTAIPAFQVKADG